MVSTNNPAGRLYNVIEHALGMKFGDQQSMGGVWAKVFGMEPDDPLKLVAMHGELAMLSREAHMELEKLNLDDSQCARYEQPFKAIEAAFSSTSIRSKWPTFTHHLKDNTMPALALIADRLAALSDEKAVERDTLLRLQKEIDGLTENLIDSSIDEALKVPLIESLNDIREMVLRYRIYGNEGLDRAHHRAAGVLCIYKGMIEQQPKSSPAWGFMKIVRDLGEIVRTASATLRLARDLGLPQLPDGG